MKEETKGKNKLKGYSGLFFDEESIKKLIEAQGNGLSDTVNNMHTTFKFGELEQFPDELIGKDFEVKVVGYASDGRNSGYRVELPEELIPYYENKNQPHITVSIGEVDGKKGKPVDTGRLNFKDLEEMFTINGRLGYFIFGKDVVMDNSEFPKIYTAEELSHKYSKYVKMGNEYSYEFNRLLNVAKNLISLKHEIVSGKIENREYGNPLTVDYTFIDDLVEILDENGLSCYDRDEWEDTDLYVGEVNKVTTLSIDGYEFKFDEGDGSKSNPHVKKEKYGSRAPEFEFNKVIKILDAKIEEFMKNHYSSIGQNEANTNAKSMADLTVAELQGIINDNDNIINGNDEAIKQALIARILEQQRIIEEQQTEIDRLKGQREL